MRSLLLLLSLWAALALCGSVSPPPGFMVGGSDRLKPGEAQLLIDAGSTHARVYMAWAYIQPEVTGPLNTSLTVDMMRADPSIVDEWAAKQDWGPIDSRISQYHDIKKDLVLIGAVADGTRVVLPRYKDDTFDPNVVGEDVYITYAYRYVRATVRHVGDSVTFWQAENELNIAWIASMTGTRRFSVLGAWHSWDFRTKLLQTLIQAIRDEQPHATITTNFYTDIQKWVFEVGLTKGYWKDAVQEWAPLVDAISIDSYPNMFIAAPCLANVTGAVVKEAKQLAGGKPTFVMETSYPWALNRHQLPGVGNFTEDNQEACVNQMFDEVVAAGGDGFLYFTFSFVRGITPPNGRYSSLDMQALELWRKFYLEDEDAALLLEWFEHGTHFAYLKYRMPFVFGGIGDGFGLMRCGGGLTKGYNALKKKYLSVPKSPGNATALSR